MPKKLSSKQVYLFEGKEQQLGQIVTKLHPNAGAGEYKKLYCRYYKRLKSGLPLEEVLSVKMIAVGRRPGSEQVSDEVLPSAQSDALEAQATEVAEAVEKTAALPLEQTPEFQAALVHAGEVYVNFPKYMNKTLAHVLLTEPTYVEWMRKRLVDNADDAGLKLLRGINKLYNDYPAAQEVVRRAVEAYYAERNAARNVPAATSLADNAKLKGLVALPTLPAVAEPSAAADAPDLAGLSYNQVLAMQAGQQAEEEALQTEQAMLDERHKVIADRLVELYHSQQRLAKQLEELKPKTPEVTDHAVVRYLERVVGMNVDELRRQIVGFEDQAWLFDYQANGNGRYPVGTTHRVHVENNTVVTVLPR